MDNQKKLPTIKSIFTLKPSSSLFNIARIMTIVLIALITAMAIVAILRVVTAINTPVEDEASKGAVVFALIVTGFPFAISISSVLSLIPFIISLVAGSRLQWKIQPTERFMVIFLGALSLIGLFFIKSLPEVINSLFTFSA